MKTIYAKDFGIKPDSNITAELIKLTNYLHSVDGEKTVVFDPGTYYIDSEKCKKYMLYITNTVDDNEFFDGETPHLNAVGFYFENISDLTFDANGAVFVIDGDATNIAMENCRNITLKNMEIRHMHPDMHELEVISKTPVSVDFKIDSDSSYFVKNGMLCFLGKFYITLCDKNAVKAGWIGLIEKDTPDRIKRVLHPLFSSLKVKNIGFFIIRVYYLNTSRFKIGSRYYIFDVRRQFAGIFVNKCDDVTIENIKQRFNYSLALVCQDSGNITVDGVEFAPEKESARKMASVADFMQFCMCRGDIVVKNSIFDGAGDDCLNVHGIHFKITNINKNELTVRFMHPQTHGFNPLRTGDMLAYINPDTLLETGRAVIENSELLNEYEIKLHVSDTNGAKNGFSIEDISACPNLEFINNTLTRIITRGLLITTRGRVNVESNRFVSTSMSGILLSDDAKSWYESGMCRDVTVRDNVFDYCGETPILIKPENRSYAGAVHKNIKIISNTFKNYDGCVLSAKDSDMITIENNKFYCGDKMKLTNCNDVKLIK